MPSTATTASLRSSTTLPPCSPNTARPVAWKRSTTARSDSGSSPGSPGWASCETTQVTSRRVGGRALGGARRRLRYVLAQDRGLERAQAGGGLDAEALDQRAVRVAVGGKRVRLAAGAVERQHQLPAEPLAQRVVLDQRLELAHERGVQAGGEVRLDALAQAGQAEVLEPSDLGLREALPRHVRQRRPAPQLERLPQRRRGLPRLAARQLLAAAPVPVLEASGVERPGAEPVPAALRAHELVAERRAQPGRHDLHGVAGVLRALALPQLVRHAVEVDDFAAMHEQQREQRQRATAGDRSGPAAVQLDLDRTEDPELRVHL